MHRKRAEKNDASVFTAQTKWCLLPYNDALGQTFFFHLKNWGSWLFIICDRKLNRNLFSLIWLKIYFMHFWFHFSLNLTETTSFFMLPLLSETWKKEKKLKTPRSAGSTQSIFGKILFCALVCGRIVADCNDVRHNFISAFSLLWQKILLFFVLIFVIYGGDLSFQKLFFFLSHTLSFEWLFSFNDVLISSPHLYWRRAKERRRESMTTERYNNWPSVQLQNKRKSSFNSKWPSTAATAAAAAFNVHI